MATAGLAGVLSTINLVLGILNAEVPNVVKAIELLTNSQTTIQQLLDDANAVENADLQQTQTELGQ